jgi:HNH endonuclease
VQPPFHITGDPNVDWIIFIVAAIVCVYWLRALRLAREGARLFLRNLAFAILALIVFQLLLTGAQVPHNNAVVLSGFAALVVFGVRKQRFRRSRYIPKSVERAVIARDLKGEKYDGKKHHIDHVWPFARGGSHTTDNLRVIAKKKNLKKGAKRPRMREMW